MRKNYKMIVAYDGSRYAGWEHQPNKTTIQGKLETVLLKLCGEPVEVIGAGRTDAGVHAMAMAANARMETSLEPASIRDYMNRYLPDDIAVTEVRDASPRFHARYNAVGKTYCYTCYDGPVKPLFYRKYVTVLEDSPDMDRMRRAADFLEGKHDFKSFCGNPKMKKSTVRVVDTIRIERRGDTICFTYHGTGFLQYMVRIMTGTLLEVGKGKMEPEQIPEILKARDRSLAGPTAPACGLCMMKVDY